MMGRPLPEKVNQIFELIIYDFDPDKATTLFNEITNPEEKILARFWIVNVSLWLNEITQLKSHVKEFQQAIDTFNDPFYNLIANIGFNAYEGILLNGFFIPGEDFLGAKTYFNNVVTLIEEYDPVLKKQDHWYYKFFEIFKRKISAFCTDDPIEKVRLFKLCIQKSDEFLDKIEKDTWTSMYKIDLFLTYIQMGELQLAIKLSDTIQLHRNKFLQYALFENLASIYYTKGNLPTALQYLKENLEFSYINRYYWGISRLKRSMGNLYEELGEFKLAEQQYKESLEVRKYFSNPINEVLAYYNLIKFFINRYHVTRDMQYLDEAKKKLFTMKNDLQYNDNKMEHNFELICEALILKYGRMSDRSQSYKILKQMIPNYPYLHELQMDLIELLLDEAKINKNNSKTLKDVINELDNLMNNLKEIKLYSHRMNIITFINYQILISKYLISIKGKISEGLEVLNFAGQELHKFDLPLLKKRINNELEVIKNQMKTWQSNMIISQPDIQHSDFAEYFNLITKISASKNS